MEISNLKINPDIIETELDGEICFYDPSNYKYLNLNSSASIIWPLFKNGYNKNKIISKITSVFLVTPKECEADLRFFFKEAINYGLLYES